LDNSVNSIYCIIIAIWSTLVVEVWKRRECEIAHIWNMADYEAEDAVRKDYDSNINQDLFSRTVKHTSFISTSLRRGSTNPPLNISAIVIVSLVFWGYISYERPNRLDL
jgi:hypothetical protein